MGRKQILSVITLGACLTMSSVARAGVHLPVPYMAQPDGQTCLPTSMMMALNFMGRIDSFSSDTVQALHKQTQYNRFNAPDIARQYGLYALPNWYNLGWTPETVKYELDHGRPVILGVNQGRSGHFILAVGYTDDGKVIVNDPSRSSWGYGIGGADKAVEWSDILWRGGVILRPEPFPEPPPLSGVAVGRDGGPLERTVDLTLTSGDDAEVSFTLVNNGRVPWPAKLYLAPEDPDSSPTQAVNSSLANGWLADNRVAEALPGLQPGTTGTVTFKVKAPDVSQTTTVLQYFNLHDDQGNWFGTSWLAGPGNRNMGVRVIVRPKNRPEWKLPLIEDAADHKVTLPWETRYSGFTVADSFTTAPPQPGEVLHLKAADHENNTAWLGDPDWADYRVEAWIYCDLRKDIAKQGWERVGLFARDNGQHAGDTKNEVEIGSNLAIGIDSDDGGVRAGSVYNGSIGDFRDKRYYLKQGGWHHFAMDCNGTTVTYSVDNEVIHTETQTRAWKNGECGVFYSAAFDPALPAEKKSQGIYFSNFKVTRPE